MYTKIYGKGYITVLRTYLFCRRKRRTKSDCFIVGEWGISLGLLSAVDWTVWLGFWSILGIIVVGTSSASGPASVSAAADTTLILYKPH